MTFAYPGGDKPVVQNIDFRLDIDEKVALIGQNGAGKTTLVKLLARLYDPTEGRILLDGIDLREYNVEDLRHEIGVIFQDYMRYDAIVRENIDPGRDTREATGVPSHAPAAVSGHRKPQPPTVVERRVVQRLNVRGLVERLSSEHLRSIQFAAPQDHAAEARKLQCARKQRAGGSGAVLDAANRVAARA